VAANTIILSNSLNSWKFIRTNYFEIWTFLGLKVWILL